MTKRDSSHIKFNINVILCYGELEEKIENYFTNESAFHFPRLLVPQSIPAGTTPRNIVGPVFATSVSFRCWDVLCSTLTSVYIVCGSCVQLLQEPLLHI